MPQNIMRALCAVIRPDHFKFASYGPEPPNKGHLFITDKPSCTNVSVIKRFHCRLCINGEHSLFDFSMEKVAVAGNQILAEGLRLKQPVFLIPLQTLPFTIPYTYTCANYTDGIQYLSHGL